MTGYELLQLITPIGIALIGFILKMILGQIEALREDLKDYVSNPTCALHRQHIETRLKALEDKQGATRA